MDGAIHQSTVVPNQQREQAIPTGATAKSSLLLVTSISETKRKKRFLSFAAVSVESKC